MDSNMRRKFEAIMDDAPEEVLFAESYPIFPHVKVRLVGEDGNAFAILGRVANAMKRGGVRKEVIEYFSKEAKSGDYDNLLCTVLKYVGELPPIVCEGCGEIPDECVCDGDNFFDEYD